MKWASLVAGVFLIGVGLFVSFGTLIMIIDYSSKFTPMTSITYWSLVGLISFTIGVLLWFKSGEIKWGKAMWFFMGVILSWLTWMTLSYFRSRPQDITQLMSATERSYYDKHSRWVKSAIARHIGRFWVFAASDGKACAWLRLHDVLFPFVIIDDRGTNRLAESIRLVGNRGQSISVDIANDGGISGYSVSTGGLFSSNSVSMMDVNMDGQYDLRIGPDREVDVNINSHWYQRISTNGQYFVELNGVAKQIIMTNGLWQLKE